MAIPVKPTSNELVLKLKFDEENTLGINKNITYEPFCKQWKRVSS